jgi:hypothetical protein
MSKINYLTITVDREDARGKAFQSQIHISPDGWSQSGDDLGDTRDLAQAIFEAVVEDMNDEDA